MICSLCHTLFAQDKAPTHPRYIIEVDSQIIKATPYEITYNKGRIVRHEIIIKTADEIITDSFMINK